MLSRRSLLRGFLAAGAAGVLPRIKARPAEIAERTLDWEMMIYGWGIHYAASPIRERTCVVLPTVFDENPVAAAELRAQIAKELA